MSLALEGKMICGQTCITATNLALQIVTKRLILKMGVPILRGVSGPQIKVGIWKLFF